MVKTRSKAKVSGVQGEQQEVHLPETLALLVKRINEADVETNNRIQRFHRGILRERKFFSDMCQQFFIALKLFMRFAHMKHAYLSRAEPGSVRFNRVKTLVRKVDRLRREFSQLKKKLKTAKRNLAYLQCDMDVCVDMTAVARETVDAIKNAENVDNLGITSTRRIPNTKWADNFYPDPEVSVGMKDLAAEWENMGLQANLKECMALLRRLVLPDVPQHLIED